MSFKAGIDDVGQDASFFKKNLVVLKEPLCRYVKTPSLLDLIRRYEVAI